MLWRITSIVLLSVVTVAQAKNPASAEFLARHIQDALRQSLHTDNEQYFEAQRNKIISAFDAETIGDFLTDAAAQMAFQPEDAAPVPDTLVKAVAPRPSTLVSIRQNLNDKRKIIAHVEQVGNQVGLPPGYMAAMALIESSINPHARRCQSRGCGAAVGLYQFVGDTGRDYGLVTARADLRTDINAATKAASRLAYDNALAIRPTMPVTAAHLYMAHQQGSIGAAATYRLAQGKRSGLSSFEEFRLMHNIGNNLPGEVRRQYFVGQCRAAGHCTWRVKPGYTDNQVALVFYQHWLVRYARFETSVRRVFAGEIKQAWS